MADFNKILNPGDYENGEINVVIEIPTGSNHKIEWDRKNACFMLDRVEPIAFAKPCNYGFIPQTLDEDGDELDVLMITDQPLTTGIYTTARVLGVMKFVDDGEVDDKTSHRDVATKTVCEHISCYGIAETVEEVSAYGNESDIAPRLVLEEITKLTERETLGTLWLYTLLCQQSARHRHQTGYQSECSSKNGILMLLAASYHLLKVREDEQGDEAHRVCTNHTE